MKRLIVSSLWLPLVLSATPLVAQSPVQAGGQPARTVPGRPSPPVERDASRLQMSVMEDAFQRAVEAAHGHAVEAMQVAAGMPPLFTFDGSTRARAFRLRGYGVFFDVDMPPVPRTIEWQLRVLDTGAVLAPDIEQLQQQVARINDPRVSRVLAPIIRSMQSKVAAGSSMVEDNANRGPATMKQASVTSSAPQDPFHNYLLEVKKTLVEVILQYGPTIQLGADDWLHVAAREMSPKLMPGNPTDATIELRIKGAELAALKAGRVTPEEAARRVEIREIY